MPPMPTNRNDTGYHPPAPPPAAYNNNARGDRYADSKEQYEMSTRTPATDSNGVISTDQFFQEVEEVKDLNRRIIDNITLIEELHGTALTNINDEQTEENAARLSQDQIPFRRAR